MIKTLSISLLILLIISGCNNKRSIEQEQATPATPTPEENNLDDHGEASEVPGIFISHQMLWNQVPARIDSMKMEKSNNNFDQFTDEEVVEFLEFYVQTMDKLNDVVWADEESEIYNTLAWAADSLHHPEAIKFEKGVKKRGFTVASSEGMIYLERDTHLLNALFSDAVSSQMAEFLKMYYKEINQPFALDGALAISVLKLVDRLLYWEGFTKKYPEFIMAPYITERYNLYLNVLLQGMNNTPAFDYQTGKLDDDFKNGYNYLLQEYPESETAGVIKQFLTILKDNEYEKTDSVKTFIREIVPQ